MIEVIIFSMKKDEKMRTRRVKNAVYICILLIVLFTGCNKNQKNDNRNEILPIEDEIKQETEIEKQDQNEEELVEEIEEDAKNQFQEAEYTNTKFIRSNQMKKKVLEKMNLEEVDTVYTKKYQKAVDGIIKQYKKKNDYTLDSPLLIMNPYGTSELGLYLYYETEEPTTLMYTIHVEADHIPDFRAILCTQALENEMHVQEGTIVGLIAGMKNYITFEEMDEDKQVIHTKKICVDLSKMSEDGQVNYIASKLNKEIDTLSALYALGTSLKSKESKIDLFDENGIKRFTINLDQPTNVELTINDQYLIYPNRKNSIVCVNANGKMEESFSLNQYRYESGLIYEKEQNMLYFVGSDKKRDSKCDLILSLNPDDGSVNVIADFKELLNDIYEEAKNSEDKKVDWIQIDSFGFVSKEQLVVNAKKLSSIYSLQLADGQASIDYIISDQKIFKDSKYEHMVYEGIGEFELFSNQNSIQVSRDDNRLVEGQYYIMMDDMDQGCYIIFVDENTKTFTLASKMGEVLEDTTSHVSLGYDGIVILQQKEDGSGLITVFDSKEDKINEYIIEQGDYYSAIRMNFAGIWFQ